jgi:hypothetical protein
MIAYLRARWDEWATRGAILCFLAICAWAAWRWHVEIWHMIAAGIAAIVAAVPDRAPAAAWCLVKKLFRRSPATPPDVRPSTENPIMGKFEEFFAAAETKIIAEVRAQIAEWAKSLPPPAAQIYADFEAYEANPSASAAAKFAADTLSEILTLLTELESTKTALSQSGVTGVGTAGVTSGTVAEPVPAA